MPVSARKAAGIIRNVLPKRVLERPPKPIILGSHEELVNRRAQIRKWEQTKSQLFKTSQGRQYLSRHFPKSYQKLVIAQHSPDSVKTARAVPVNIQKELGQLYPSFHRRIMNQKTPRLPQLPPFPLGRKKVYLPNIVVTLKRNPRLEPYHAVFEVPLNLSKLDLRDYLWNLYGVKSLSIRSQVLPGRLRRIHKVPDLPRRIGPMKRTRARKKMIVHLAKPFRYPRELTKGELREYIPSWSSLIVDSRRNDMIWL